MVSTSVVVSIVLSNKKTPVTVGGFELPFALETNTQNPPVTGVFLKNSFRLLRWILSSAACY